MVVRCIDHVQIAMPPGGENEGRRFYGQVLGLTEVAKPASLAGRGGVWFEDDQIKIHLGAEPGFKPARKAHVCFAVDDLDTTAKEMAAQEFEVRPDTAISTIKRFFTADPFGNRIEIMQAAHQA